MKILFLTNNSNSEPVYSFLKDQKDLFVTKYEQKLTKEVVVEFNPDFIISYGYRFIIKNDIIVLFRNRIINLHISLLPWNKGADPNLWSFLEDTPKGVTIHYIDEGIDTGDIILQKEVYLTENSHTLVSSYDILHKTIQDLFINNWDYIKINNIRPHKQESKGSTHYLKELQSLRSIIAEKGWNIKIKEMKKIYENLKNDN